MIGNYCICVVVLVDWVVGDKIGICGVYGMVNDYVVVWFIGCVFIVLVVYIWVFNKDDKYSEVVIVVVVRFVFEGLGVNG